jgi:5-methyltetrahydropteroyltriglutamate--homocysteine methyltransferase
MCTSRTRRASGSTRPRRWRSTGRSPCATRSSGTPSPSCATTPTRRSPRSRSRRQHGPLPRRQSSIDSSVYPDLAEFWADLTGAYAQELQGLYDLGARYIQLDDTSLAYVNDPEQRKHITDIGGDPEHLHEQYIANMNRSLAGRPDDLRITTHLCRGNNQSMWAAEGGYDFVAEALFGDLNVDGYFLRVRRRALGWLRAAALRARGQVRGARARDDEEAPAREQGRAQAPHRGGVQVRPARPALPVAPARFSSTVEGNKLTEDDQKAKLALVVETASEVWG